MNQRGSGEGNTCEILLPPYSAVLGSWFAVKVTYAKNLRVIPVWA